MIRQLLLGVYAPAYRYLLRPLIFLQDAQTTHHQMLHLLRFFDQRPALLRAVHQHTFKAQPVTVGGVTLPHPLMLAAGFVKGDGFSSEDEAHAAIQAGKNIIPGWRSMPALVGAVEFGSFTRYPRLGNSGVVVWRDAKTQSTQNRVGLKNPGATAAATFLATKPLPSTFGINIAVSPGVDDPAQEQQEVIEAFDAFLTRAIRPSWFTLNISCPNTEDDPHNHQTEARTRDLCRLVNSRLESIPLWVKISPNLAPSQYETLLRVFAEEGVQAVIATNTLSAPAPTDSTLTAGVGGGRLHVAAVDAVRQCAEIQRQNGYPVDIIGCGGVIEPQHYHAFTAQGLKAVQYWSALIYKGPLAAALILNKE